MTDYYSDSFEDIDIEYMLRVCGAIGGLTALREETGKTNNDIISDFKESAVAAFLGYNKVHEKKHGMDACSQDDSGEMYYLEIKNTTPTVCKATFNDTTEDKIEFFRQDNVYLACAIWSDEITIEKVVYGPMKEICDDLERLRLNEVDNQSRSTQSFRYSRLKSLPGFTEYYPGNVTSFLEQKHIAASGQMTLDDLW